MPPVIYVAYKGARHACRPGETVLDCLARQGVKVPSSCRSGICQSCVLQRLDGSPPVEAQRGLSPGLRESRHFLACQCVAMTDMEVGPPGGELWSARARVVDKRLLAPGVARLRLVPREAAPYRGGQFVHLMRDDGLVRSFSLASLLEDGFLELHVRRVPGGAMSEWIHDVLAVGDELTVRGPAGECFYAPERAEQPHLLVGTGTGVAPLFAMARDALRHGHGAPIALIHSARSREGLYLDGELRELGARHPAFAYRPLVVDRGAGAALLEEAVLEVVPRPAGWRVALCGAPDVVHRLRRRLFLAGASSKDISSDAFASAPRG